MLVEYNQYIFLVWHDENLASEDILFSVLLQHQNQQRNLVQYSIVEHVLHKQDVE